MPLDPSIIMGVKPPEIPDPQEFQNKSLTLQNLMQQREAGQLTLEKTRQGVRDDAAAREAFKAGGTESEIYNRLLAVDPTRAQAYKKFNEESRGREAQTEQHRTTAVKQTWEVKKEQLERGVNYFNFAKDADSFEQVLRLGVVDKAWTQEQADAWRKMGYSPQLVQTIQSGGMTRAQQLEAENRQATTAETGRHNVTTEGQTQATAPFTMGPGGPVPNLPVQEYERSKLPGGQPHYDAGRGIVVNPAAATAQPVIMGGQPLPQKRELGPPQEVNTPSGPRLVVQDKQSGQMLDANTMQPITGIGPKLGEGAQKQLTGAGVTRDAITTYRDALKSFNVADALNPQARASMGTVYHNLLLQAKEAFNLGVLNGQDYAILQKVITDPTSAKGTFLTKETLDKQAKTLDGILERVEKKINQIQSGVTPTSSMQVTPEQQAGRDDEAAAIRAREPVEKIQADIASLEDALKNTRLNGDQRRILSGELILQKKALALKGAGPAPVVAPTAPPGTGTTGGATGGWSIKQVN